MEAHEGDRIVIESNRVGSRARAGEILEVDLHEDGPSYRVRWEDGHESIFYPTSGARIESQNA